ncbi:MAG: 3-hydroxyacyl-CoA dehydrogenase [Nevskiaceae bacterium]|nr:MAG: 3-hydroxyacyl-CoA dehydrogenase [Nevskiaceae bacterium]TBR71328.1 MAG: 3-hydroxyacyl-CoA dehydrogenase [Nevskiaceae bacterium]
MQVPVSTRLNGRVLVVTIDNPPVNALGTEVRHGLEDALRQAQDASVAAVVLLGAGRHFIAGADIREFGKPPQTPFLPDVCNHIEACAKPVVAALHGSVLGGGLEVAMAAHYRIARTDARLGLPEVNLGLMPGAGGTQRAPRLIGAGAALDLILSGKPVNGARALALGLVDRLAQTEDLEAEALAYANDLLAAGGRPRRTRDLAIADADAARRVVTDARATQAKKAVGLFSPHRIVDAVEAAIEKPFEEGLAVERRLFLQCMASPQRKGLIHAFFAEREVAKVPELAGIQPRPLERVGVVGGGTMGAGIAVACLRGGFEVTMVERDEANCARGRQNVEKLLAAWLARGRISSTEHDRLLGAFITTTEYARLGNADLVIEAVFEDLKVKQAVFAGFDRVCKPGAVLASNTSYLDVNVLAAGTPRPADVIGLHFFSPAHVMKLLEIVVADRTAQDVVATAFALARKLGKTAVRAGVCDGFIGNRILACYRQVAYRLIEAGATPYAVDAAVRHFGYPIGPFQMFDLAGGDIGWAMRKRQAATRDPRDHYVRIPDVLCERGWFGQKTGQGWYRYAPGSRAGEEDPEVLALIEEERRRAGVTPRAIDADEILQRYLAAMINAGADVVNDGIALRPLDVDVVLMAGYGFPRHRGGPMAYADEIGLPKVLADVRRFAVEDARFWKPSPLLARLVGEGRNFASLNAAH